MTNPSPPAWALEQASKLVFNYLHDIGVKEDETTNYEDEFIDQITLTIVAARRAALEEATDIGLEAVRFAHEWIGGLPVTPSFEDKRSAQAALELAERKLRALADREPTP